MNAHMYGSFISSVGTDDITWNNSYADYLYMYLQILVLNLFFALCLSLTIERPFMKIAKRITLPMCCEY